MTWPVPARRLAALAVLGAVAVFVLPDLGRTDVGLLELDNRFLFINLAILVLAALDTLAAPAPSSIRVTRTHPRAVTLDQPTTISWQVETPDGMRPRGSSARGEPGR